MPWSAASATHAEQGQPQSDQTAWGGQGLASPAGRTGRALVRHVGRLRRADRKCELIAQNLAVPVLEISIDRDVEIRVLGPVLGGHQVDHVRVRAVVHPDVGGEVPTVRILHREQFWVRGAAGESDGDDDGKTRLREAVVPCMTCLLYTSPSPRD